MQFESARLVFREFTENDFLLFYSVFSNDEVMKYALIDKYNSEEDILTYFQEVLENSHTADNRLVYQFAVSLGSTGGFIGFADMEIHMQNRFGGCGEIGYFLLPSFWGNGFATEIATALMEFCFTQLNLHRVTARCNANNIASERVMRKAGMVNEGEFRKVRFKNGQWENEKQYCILKPEWESRLKL